MIAPPDRRSPNRDGSALSAPPSAASPQTDEPHAKREPIALLILILAGIFVVGLGGLVIGSAAWATFGGGNNFQGARSIVVSASFLTAAGAVAWFFDRTWKRLGAVVLFVVVMTLPGTMLVWAAVEGDSGTEPGRADTIADSEGFSLATCNSTWLQLDPATAAQLGPRSDFIDLCTSPANRSFMCDYDPTIPEC